jgi:hypothetical protein
MKKKLLLWTSLVTKYASIGAGAASLPIFAVLPPAVGGYAVVAFGIASAIKDTANRIGDLADDGIINGSYKGN